MKRKDIIKWHLTSDGMIRFYRDDEKKSGVSEMVLAPPSGIIGALNCGNVNKVIVINDDGQTIHPVQGQESL